MSIGGHLRAEVDSNAFVAGLVEHSEDSAASAGKLNHTLTRRGSYAELGEEGGVEALLDLRVPGEGCLVDLRRTVELV